MKQSNQKGSSFLTKIAILISFSPLFMGYSIVSLSMIEQPMALRNNLSADESTYYLSLLTSILPLLAILGSFLITPLSDALGQNTLMALCNLISIIASFIMWEGITIINLLIGRALIGVYCGIMLGVVPPFLISMAPIHLKGLFGTLTQLMITIGVALAYFLGGLMSDPQLYMFCPILFVIIQFLTLFYFPFNNIERHIQNQEIFALTKFTFLVYGHSDVSFLLNNTHTQELVNRIAKEENGQANKQLSTRERNQIYEQNLTNKIIIVLAMANQLSGINAIIMYANQLFSLISNDPLGSLLKLGLFQVVITALSTVFVEKLGRRTIMLGGGSIVVCSLFLGFFFSAYPKVLLFVIFIHMFGFSISVGPVCMLYAAEIRKNLQLMSIMIWSFTLLVTSVSAIMMKNMGVGNTLGTFGFFSLGCLLYLNKNMIQTKGLTRAQIIQELKSQQPILN